MVKVGNFNDSYMAEMFIELLKSNDIEAYLNESGAGQYTDIIMGRSMGGYDVFVDEADANKAKALFYELESRPDLDALAEEFGKEVYEDDLEYHKNIKLDKRRNAVRFFILGIFAIAIILSVVSYYYNLEGVIFK